MYFEPTTSIVHCVQSFAREFVKGITAVSQVSGSEDLKELCSALEGEIAQAKLVLVGPNPEAHFGPKKTKKHKRHTQTERCETEFGISSSNKIQQKY